MHLLLLILTIDLVLAGQNSRLEVRSPGSPPRNTRSSIPGVPYNQTPKGSRRLSPLTTDPGARGESQKPQANRGTNAEQNAKNVPPLPAASTLFRPVALRPAVVKPIALRPTVPREARPTLAAFQKNFFQGRLLDANTRASLPQATIKTAAGSEKDVSRTQNTISGATVNRPSSVPVQSTRTGLSAFRPPNIGQSSRPVLPTAPARPQIPFNLQMPYLRPDATILRNIEQQNKKLILDISGKLYRLNADRAAAERALSRSSKKAKASQKMVQQNKSSQKVSPLPEIPKSQTLARQISMPEIPMPTISNIRPGVHTDTNFVSEKQRRRRNDQSESSESSSATSDESGLPALRSLSGSRANLRMPETTPMLESIPIEASESPVQSHRQSRSQENFLKLPPARTDLENRLPMLQSTSISRANFWSPIADPRTITTGISAKDHEKQHDQRPSSENQQAHPSRLVLAKKRQREPTEERSHISFTDLMADLNSASPSNELQGELVEATKSKPSPATARAKRKMILSVKRSGGSSIKRKRLSKAGSPIPFAELMDSLDTGSLSEESQHELMKAANPSLFSAAARAKRKMILSVKRSGSNPVKRKQSSKAEGSQISFADLMAGLDRDSPSKSEANRGGPGENILQQHLLPHPAINSPSTAMTNSPRPFQVGDGIRDNIGSPNAESPSQGFREFENIFFRVPSDEWDTIQ